MNSGPREPAPLAPPRRAEREPPRAAPAPERLDPARVLLPTRFLDGLAEPRSAGARLCDGTRSVAELAAAAGLDLDVTVGVLSRCFAAGLLCEADPGPVPPLLFFEHVRALCLRFRQARLREAPGLEAVFSAGGYSERLAVGYLLEVTHVVRGAASHIAAAIAHAPDERLQLALAEYLEDEYWHGGLMERSLRAAGLSDDELRRALPLPETQAVLNSWRHAAHADLLLYGGLIAVTESGPADTSDVEALFHKTLAQGVLPEAAWRPYFEHAFGDSAADHLAHGRAVFAALGPQPRERRDALRGQLLLHTETVLRQERAILAFYAAAHGPRIHALDVAP